jgi:hypothetical protein
MSNAEGNWDISVDPIIPGRSQESNNPVQLPAFVCLRCANELKMRLWQIYDRKYGDDLVWDERNNLGPDAIQMRYGLRANKRRFGQEAENAKAATNAILLARQMSARLDQLVAKGVCKRKPDGREAYVIFDDRANTPPAVAPGVLP